MRKIFNYSDRLVIVNTKVLCTVTDNVLYKWVYNCLQCQKNIVSINLFQNGVVKNINDLIIFTKVSIERMTEEEKWINESNKYKTNSWNIIKKHNTHFDKVIKMKPPNKENLSQTLNLQSQK